jgi:antitoxin MazE
MKTKVESWGNSLAVRLPRPLAEDAGVRRGTTVDLRVEGNRIVLRPVRRKSYRLGQLLSRVKPSNLHGEIDAGPAIGRESW